MLRVGLAFAAFPSALLHTGCSANENRSSAKPADLQENQANANNENTDSAVEGSSMQIQYLEIVTKEVDEVCATYSKIHGVSFGESDQNLGGARTAELANGGLLGVRAPLRDNEDPVVRPYLLVEDIQAAVDAAAESGAEVALPPMELTGHGTCAIVIQGGIESGFWQL